MNANDYASILENQGHKYIADFVRQQQALIEQLEKTQDYLYKTHDADKAEIEFLKKEILAKHEDWKHAGQQAANAKAEIEHLKGLIVLLKMQVNGLKKASEK